MIRDHDQDCKIRNPPDTHGKLPLHALPDTTESDRQLSYSPAGRHPVQGPSQRRLPCRFQRSDRHEVLAALVSNVLQQKHLMAARMSSADLCHRNGPEALLTVSMQAVMVRSGSTIKR